MILCQAKPQETSPHCTGVAEQKAQEPGHTEAETTQTEAHTANRIQKNEKRACGPGATSNGLMDGEAVQRRGERKSLVRVARNFQISQNQQQSNKS